MSLAVIDPIEDSVFEDASVYVVEPAHQGYLKIKTYWGDYGFFYKSYNRLNFNILIFTDKDDVCDRYLVGNADEIDEVMNVIEAAKNLCEEAYNARA